MEEEISAGDGNKRWTLSTHHLPLGVGGWQLHGHPGAFQTRNATPLEKMRAAFEQTTTSYSWTHFKHDNCKAAGTALKLRHTNVLHPGVCKPAYTEDEWQILLLDTTSQSRLQVFEHPSRTWSIVASALSRFCVFSMQSPTDFPDFAVTKETSVQ